MAELPSGTVTFLLTDIEGSTRRWEQDPEAMRATLVRHDALLMAGIERHGGVVVKSRGEGDSFFAVFARATDAVAAAADLQRALQAEAWPTDAPPRVRMALHTGEADLRQRDYFGTAVNRCALDLFRTKAAGSGHAREMAGAFLGRRSLPTMDGAPHHRVFGHEHARLGRLPRRSPLAHGRPQRLFVRNPEFSSRAEGCTLDRQTARGDCPGRKARATTRAARTGQPPGRCSDPRLAATALMSALTRPEVSWLYQTRRRTCRESACR